MLNRRMITLFLPTIMLERLFEKSLEENLSMAALVRRYMCRPLKISPEAFHKMMGPVKEHQARQKKPVWRIATKTGRSAAFAMAVPEPMHRKLKREAARRGFSMSWLVTTALMFPLGITQDDLNQFNGMELPLKKDRYPGVFRDIQKSRLW